LTREPVSAYPIVREKFPTGRSEPLAIEFERIVGDWLSASGTFQRVIYSPSLISRVNCHRPVVRVPV
jgi:hypothetical protein